MNNKIYLCILSSLIYFQCISPAYAVDFTAEQLYTDCLKNSEETSNATLSVNEEFQSGFCIGYVKGLDDMLAVHYLTKHNKGKKLGFYCMPDGITLNDMIAVFIEYMKKHPERNNDPGGKVLLESLMFKYPC